MNRFGERLRNKILDFGFFDFENFKIFDISDENHYLRFSMKNIFSKFSVALEKKFALVASQTRL